MSTVKEGRGRTYSAEAAGRDGTLRCHVVRQLLLHEQRIQCGIFIWNDSDSDAHAIVFLPEAADVRYRSIVQTVVGPRSDFSTNVMLALGTGGGFPEIHVAVASGDVQFTLAVPSLEGTPLSPAVTAWETPGGHIGSAPLAVPVFAPGIQLTPSLPPAQASGRPSEPPAAAVRLVHPSLPVLSPPVAPLATFLLAVLTGFGAFAARPQIDHLTVPAFAVPGTTVTIGYRAAGLGGAAFDVFGPDGSSVAAGPLPFGSGTFGVQLPSSAPARAYLVRVRVSNLLGTDVAEEYLRVTGPPEPAAAAVPPPLPAPRRQPAPAPVPPPEIRSLALDRATVASGETVNVYYDVAAGSGTVALVDTASQITYGRAALTEGGRATFTAPHVDDPRTLAVILEAKRGRAVAHSRIAIMVTPADTLPAQNDGAADGGGDAAGSDRTNAASTTISAPASVRAGQPIRVDVRGAEGGLHVVLLDDSGIAVAQRAAPPGASRVLIAAPTVGHAARYTIEATYPRGAGSETVVRSITVTP